MKPSLCFLGGCKFDDNCNSVIDGLNLQQQQIKSLPEWFSSAKQNTETKSLLSV